MRSSPSWVWNTPGDIPASVKARVSWNGITEYPESEGTHRIIEWCRNLHIPHPEQPLSTFPASAEGLTPWKGLKQACGSTIMLEEDEAPTWCELELFQGHSGVPAERHELLKTQSATEISAPVALSGCAKIPN